MSLLTSHDGHVLTLTIDRPEKRNALNEEVMLALTEALKSVDLNGDVRVIVLTASGDKAFCAGGDLGGDQNTFGPSHSQPTTVYADLLRLAWKLPVPIIGRINGHCLAGGMGLLSVCDMAVASSEARFGLPEVKVGLFPMQVAAFMQRMIPPRTFAQMCFTGELIGAEAAFEFGLVNYVVSPDLLDSKVEWLVNRVIDKSPTAIRLGKHALRQINDMSVDEALAYMEAQVSLLPLTEDAQEGLAAFREKRSPEWTGK